MRRGAQQRVKFVWAILYLVLALGVFPGSAEEARFTSLTIEERLGIRLDLSAIPSDLALPKTGLLLGLGADLLALGANVEVRRSPARLVKDFRIDTRETGPGEDRSQLSGDYCYLVTVFVEEQGRAQDGPTLVLEEIQAGPVILGTSPDRRVTLSWAVPELLRNTAALGATVGYRVYRAGFEDGEVRDCRLLPLDRYGLVSEIRLAGDEALVSFEDDGRRPLGRAPQLKEGGNLVVEGVTNLGLSDGLARLNLAPRVQAGLPPLVLAFDGSGIQAGTWAWAMAAWPPGVVLNLPSAPSQPTELALVEQFPGGGIARLAFIGPAGTAEIRLGSPAVGGTFTILDVFRPATPRFQINAAGHVGIGVAAPIVPGLPLGSVQIAGSVGIGAAPPGPPVPAGSAQFAGNVGIGIAPVAAAMLSIGAVAPTPASIQLDSTGVAGRIWRLESTPVGSFVLSDESFPPPVQRRFEVSGPQGNTELFVGDPTPPLGPASRGTLTVTDVALQPGGATRLVLGAGGTNTQIAIGAPAVPAGPGQPALSAAPGSFSIIDFSAAAVPRLIINPAGNVGLGIGTPAYRLHIADLPPAPGLPAGAPASLALDTGRLGGNAWTMTSVPTGEFVLALAGAGAGALCTGAPRLEMSPAGAVSIGLPVPATPPGSLTVAHSLGVGVNAPAGCGDVAFAGSLDVGGNVVAGGQVQLGNFAAAPIAIGTGALYYDTSTNQAFLWNGLGWQPLAGVPGPAGPPGPGIADVELQVSYVPHGRTVTNSATLLDLPGTRDKSLVLSLQIPGPPPATVDFTTADERYVLTAGDTMTGTLKLPELEASGQVFADWLVVGEPGFTHCWSLINPDDGPDLALGPVDPTDLAKLTLTVMKFSRTTGLVRVTNDLEVGKGLTVFGSAELTGDVLVGGKLDTLGLLTARTARVTGTLRVDGAATFAANATVGQHLEVGGDADILGALTVADSAELMSTLQVGSWMKAESFAFAKWLVIGPASGNLANSWGIVRTPGDGAGTLTIGTFVTAADAGQGKLHVPVLSLTSDSMTANWPTTFLRGVTVGREEAPANLIVHGDLTVHGIKFFAQEHPGDPTQVITYAALEGPEAGTYIRGTAQLREGVAVIELPEHFALVTSEQGLTVQVTPLEECNGLYVAGKSPRRIVVKELLGGKSNARFDYLVQGVRKGYEGLAPVRATTEVSP